MASFEGSYAKPKVPRRAELPHAIDELQDAAVTTEPEPYLGGLNSYGERTICLIQAKFTHRAMPFER